MIFTIGHSTHPIGRFLGLLSCHGVTLLVDVRRFPRSRRHPQFNRDSLGPSLAAAGIGYLHAEALGGMREPRPGSPNAAWREPAFRAYADHTRTPEFLACLDELVRLARQHVLALMCAEANPLECHRQLIADALLARGLPVRHVLADGRVRDHQLTPFARVRSGVVTYPDLLSY